MKPAVRQMRGPGMNKGLKKPRHAKFPKADAKKSSSVVDTAGSAGSSGDRKDYSKGNSYLSRNVWK